MWLAAMREQAFRTCMFGRIGTLVTALILCAAVEPAGADSGKATVVGTVRMEGSIPPPEHVLVNRDTDFCGVTINIQPVVAPTAEKWLQHTIVSVSGPQLEHQAPRQAIAPINNQKCAFIPRISAMQVGDVVEIGNADPVLHNTHIRHDTQTILNVAMVPSGRTIRKSIKEPGLLKLQCDAHKFMRGYIMVFEHPYFAITDEHGGFRITGLPPGPIQITVWHETLGTLRRQVTVPAEGAVSADFVYSFTSGQ
jgi:plastocyanin